MIRGLLTALMVGTGLLLASAGASAHHSVSGEFDENKPIEFTGTVKGVQWTNPHMYTQVEAKDPSGKLQVWRVEGGAPNSLYRNGWRRDTLKPGTVVVFKGVRGNAADSVNVHGELFLEDGTTKLWVGRIPETLAAR